MKFKIHFTVGDTDDYVIVESSTLEEIRRIAAIEVHRRGGKDPWSEVIGEEEQNGA